MRSGESSFGHILSKVNLLLDELASTDLNIGVIHQNELASKFINIFDFLFKDSENPDNFFSVLINKFFFDLFFFVVSFKIFF